MLLIGEDVGTNLDALLSGFVVATEVAVFSMLMRLVACCYSSVAFEPGAVGLTVLKIGG